MNQENTSVIIEKEIEELKNEREKIDKKIQELQQELIDLKFEELIKNEILINSIWKPRKNFDKFIIEITNGNGNPIFNIYKSKLIKLFKPDYHDSFIYDKDIILAFNDNDVILSSYNLEKLSRVIQEWKLTIDYSYYEKNIEALEKEKRIAIDYLTKLKELV